jgi:two-component system cell cycle response regulator CtrA
MTPRVEDSSHEHDSHDMSFVPEARVAETLVRIGGLTVDLDGRRARVNGALVQLTAREFDCLAFLARRRGVTLTKEMFLAHLYAGRDEPEMKIIDVFICKVRRKLADAGAAGVIETVWGRGYRIP